MARYIRYDVSEAEAQLEADATRMLREAGLTKDGRTKAQSPVAGQRSFEGRIISCPFSGYSRKR